jgi:RNA polymerase sigma-70 factor (ECF subfamily)
VKAGDRQAWERFADLYGPLVYRWCRETGLKDEDAADVVQEVFGTAAVRVAEFQRPEKGGGLRSWLRAITRNKIGDLFRRLSKHAQAEGGTAALERLQQVPEPSELSTTSSQPREDAMVTHRSLQHVQSEFEERTWQAFLALTVEGRAPADVAEDLGMTLRAVYKAKSRVLCRLRQELDDFPC